jgi:hypothetical protein
LYPGSPELRDGCPSAGLGLACAIASKFCICFQRSAVLMHATSLLGVSFAWLSHGSDAITPVVGATTAASAATQSAANHERGRCDLKCRGVNSLPLLGPWRSGRWPVPVRTHVQPRDNDRSRSPTPRVPMSYPNARSGGRGKTTFFSLTAVCAPGNPWRQTPRPAASAQRPVSPSTISLSPSRS